MSRTALPAYLSSVCGSANLNTSLLPDRFADFTGPNDAHYVICLDAWTNLSNCVPPDSQSMSHQQNWMYPQDEASRNEALSAAHNQVDVALLTAVAAPHSGAFLQAISMSMIGTRLDDTSFRIAVAIRLGAPVSNHTSAFVGPPSKVSGCMVSAVGNQAVGLPDIQPSIGSSKPPYRQLRFRQDSNLQGLVHGDNKRPVGVSTMPWSEVDVWLGTSPAQTLWLQVISTVPFLVQELLHQMQKH